MCVAAMSGLNFVIVYAWQSIPEIAGKSNELIFKASLVVEPALLVDLVSVLIHCVFVFRHLPGRANHKLVVVVDVDDLTDPVVVAFRVLVIGVRGSVPNPSDKGDSCLVLGL